LFVVDLFARDVERPNSFVKSVERKNDLMFGNQTILRLQYAAQLRKARRELDGSQASELRDQIVILSYRAGPDEPGPEKSFDLTSAALAQRWNAGYFDMMHAFELNSDDELVFVRRRSPNDSFGGGLTADKNG
jgi:NTE family protein